MARIYVHVMSLCTFMCSMIIVTLFIIGAVYHHEIVMASRNDIIQINATIVNCTQFTRTCSKTVCTYTKLFWVPPQPVPPKPNPRPPKCHEETYNCSTFEYILVVNDTMIPQSGECTNGSTVAMYYSRDHFDGYKFDMESIDPTNAIIAMSIIGSAILVMFSIAMCAMYCCSWDDRSSKKILVPRSMIEPDYYSCCICY